MKRQFFLSVLFCFPLSLTGQITFNHRYHFNYLAAVLTSIVPTDSCYYATGIIADTIFPYNTGNVFVKFNLEGYPLLIKTITSTTKTYETWDKGLRSLEDGGFVVNGYSFDTIMNALLIKFNTEGDTVFTKQYPNPVHPEAAIIPRGGFGITTDGGTVMSCWIGNIPGNVTNTNIYLIKTDNFGNKEWGKVYGNAMWDRPESLIVTPENKIVLGAIRTNDNTAVENYTYWTHIFQVDSLGNLEWDYVSPFADGLKDAANDMALLEDGSLVVASGVGTEYERTSVNVVWFEKMLFKLNPAHELEWETTFMGDRPTSFTTLNNVIRLTDGSGYVAAGITPQPPANPNSDDWVSEGWLVKVSSEGDSLWARSYVGIETANSRHQVIDLKETTDGGIILCGESRNPYADSIPQQAWLLKLDEYGCLVPGCGLTDISEEVIDGFRLDIFPNPTTDYLNIYFRSAQHSRELSFCIVDAQGRVVKTFPSERADLTFILPVWDWAPGIYFLQYLEDGKIRKTEKFIKQ